VIDPADDARAIMRAVDRERLSIRAVLVTHAHFDHIMAASAVAAATGAPVGLHRDGLPLYSQGGGAAMFGMEAPDLPEPGLWLEEGAGVAFGSLGLAEITILPYFPLDHVAFQGSEHFEAWRHGLLDLLVGTALLFGYRVFVSGRVPDYSRYGRPLAPRSLMARGASLTAGDTTSAPPDGSVLRRHRLPSMRYGRSAGSRRRRCHSEAHVRVERRS
jgi:hypothetical protein